MKLSVCCIVGLGLALAAVAEKVDSTYIMPVTATRPYSTAQYWLSTKPAKEGGVLTFANQTADCKSFFNLDTGSLTFGGIDFGNGGFMINGSAFTLAGDGCLRTSNETGCFIATPVTLPGGTTMTKRGKGKLTFTTGISGAGKLVVAEGTVISQDGEHFMTEGDLDIRTGHISWYQPATSGDVAVGCGNVTFGPDRAQIVVTKGEVTSYVATMKSLSRNPAGGFLELRTSGTIATLGEAEKFLVEGRASDDGTYVDASVVSRGEGNIGDELSFLRYDAEKGFVPAETAPFVEGQSADGMVAVITEDTVVRANTAVSALKIENGAQLTIASGVTLTVGDGVHPAGVIWSGTGLRVRSGDANAYCWKGSGKLQFAEGADGLIYYNGSMANGSSSWTGAPCVYLDGLAIAGDRGVTFAGVGNNNRDYGTFSIRDSSVVAWTGGTHVLGIRLHVNDNGSMKKLPSPVYVLGDMAHSCGGEIRQNNAGPFAQDFYLGGQGVGWGTSHCGVFDWGGSPSATFTGRVTLLNDALFTHDNKGGGADGNGNCVFKGGLSGPGALISHPDGHSRTDVAGPADFTGGYKMENMNHGFYVTGPNGNPGLGPIVSTAAAAPVEFRRLDGMVASNDFALAGSMDFTSCTNVAFLGQVTAAGSRIFGDLTLGCGTAGVSLGLLDLQDCAPVFTAAEPHGVIRLGAEGGDLDCRAVTFADGADGQPLDVEKVASDTVTVSSLGGTGAVRVRAGTLSLSTNLLSLAGCAYHLDASDAPSFTFDDGGNVTKWTSSAGLAMTFSAASETATATRTDELNGRKVVTFTRDASNVKLSSRLLGDKTALQRTVIFVVRPRDNAVNAGLFGVKDGDRGLRTSGSTSWNVYPAQGGAFASGALYVNGAFSSNGAYANNTWMLVTAVHAATPTTCPVEFIPALGAYVTYDANRAFNGDLAEVVAFPGILSDDVRKAWENALAAKWGLATPHPDFTPSGTSGFSGASIDVSVGATFDLNGRSATVGSLSGAGTIANSSSNPVTLTVTDDNAFAGRVVGPVTIVVKEASTAVCELKGGASLVADGAAVRLGTANGGIVTDGLVYWLDASKPETVQTNAAGLVTNWLCRAGTIASFSNPGKVNSPKSEPLLPPTYVPSADVFGGRPAVRFVDGPGSGGVGTNVLKSTSSGTVRTVIFVGRFDSLKNPSSGNIGFWTTTKGEAGFFPLNRNDSNFTLRTFTGTTFHRYGYLQQAVGIDTVTGEEVFYDHTQALTESEFRVPNKFVLVSELDDSADNFGSYTDRSFYLGCGYHGAWLGWFGEVLAYDRCLTAEEVKTMQEYLMDKWLRAAPYVEERPVVSADGGIGLANGGSIDFGGAAATVKTLGGGGTVSNFASLEVTDGFVFNVANGEVEKLTVDGDLMIGSSAVATFLNGDTLDRTRAPQSALEVTGQVTGGSLTTAEGLPRQWLWTRMGERLWCLCKRGLLLFFK